jgi:flagellum-specific peptidoglycan hydrolase FlgJ
MYKKLLLLLTAVLLISCGGGKSTASKSSRSVYKKTTTTRVATRKPVVKKPVKKVATTSTSSKPKAQTSGPPPETLEATSRVKVTTEIVLAYIDDYKDTAKRNMAKYGIPSSIILAQGILESGAGTGTLSAKANNHFGIKCHTDWTGESVRHPDHSYRDHALFLTTRSRYASLFELDKGDYKAWAKGLRSAGYATDPRYPDKLIGLIERYQLDQFDAEVLGKQYVAARPKPGLASEGFYMVSPGDTLYSISKRFSLSVDDLKRLNSLSDNAISIGQNLKVK